MTFRLPPYPYDRLAGLAKVAEAHEGGMVDCSIGTPYDPPPPAVMEALATSGSERGYPASAGSPALRVAAADWLTRRFGLDGVDPSAVAACVGTKELVASVPHVLGLRTPDKDTVLYPAVSYPTYAMGAALAGCRAVPVPAVPGRLGGLDLDAIGPGDAARALVLWSNSPSNPTGGLGDLGAEARWGRAHGVPVFSDECYAEFTWDGPPRSVLQHGSDGVVAVHSLSKRSNLAGVRVGFYGETPSWWSSSEPCASTPASWFPARRRPPARPRWPTKSTSWPSGSVTGSASPSWPASSAATAARWAFRRGASISGCPCQPAAGATPGAWPRPWPPTAGCS